LKIYKYHAGAVQALEVKKDIDNEGFYITADEKPASLAFACLKRFKKGAWPVTEKNAVIERILYFRSVNDELDRKKIPNLKKIEALRKMLTGKKELK